MQIELKNLGFYYSKGKWNFRNLNYTFKSDRIYGLLGDSGIGKSTLAKLICGYEKPVEGQVLIDGKLHGKGYRPVQLIFQHPEKAINPRFRMKDAVSEGGTPDESLLQRLGIEKEWLSRYPNELSGGELQRFCIARALGQGTRFIVADEMSAMLDVITQAQIWNTLTGEIRSRKQGLIVITHDKDLAYKICDEFVEMEQLLS